MVAKHRIMIVDDHAVLRSGLKLLVNAQTDFEVVYDCATAEEALKAMAKVKPDLAIVDLTLGNSSGLSLVKELKAGQQIKVLVLTMHADEAYLKEVIDLGGDGYVLKQAADTDLLGALRRIMAGERVFDALLSQRLLQRWASNAVHVEPQPGTVSAREREVLALVALGHTNQQIAKALSISVKTVESHRARIREKLNLRHRSDLVRYAMEHGIIKQHLKD